MKKVLIIGFLYPFTIPGGSYRTYPLAKYLPEYGWEPTVITPALTEPTDLPFRVIETGYHDHLASWKKLLRLNTDNDIKVEIRSKFGAASANPWLEFMMRCAGMLLNYPDAHRGWIPEARRVADALLEQETFDVMISCHPVATCHVIASYLKSRHPIPWIADYADLWSRNHNYHYGPIRRWLDTRLEKKTLFGADSIVSVNPYWAESLKSLHRGKTAHTLTHGFDPEEVNDPPHELTGKFTITFTGSLSDGMQDLGLFVASLRELIDRRVVDSNDLEIRFYGLKSAWFEDTVTKYEMGDIINHYGKLPRREILSRQRDSQLLLNINWEGRLGRSMHALKLFEYLAARRPIIATGGADNLMTQQLLADTGAGVFAPRKEDVMSSLESFYREYKAGGSVSYRGDPKRVETYSYRQVAGRFAGILEEAVAANAGRN